MFYLRLFVLYGYKSFLNIIFLIKYNKFKERKEQVHGVNLGNKSLHLWVFVCHVVSAYNYFT